MVFLFSLSLFFIKFIITSSLKVLITVCGLCLGYSYSSIYGFVYFVVWFGFRCFFFLCIPIVLDWCFSVSVYLFDFFGLLLLLFLRNRFLLVPVLNVVGRELFCMFVLHLSYITTFFLLLLDLKTWVVLIGSFISIVYDTRRNTLYFICHGWYSINTVLSPCL